MAFKINNEEPPDYARPAVPVVKRPDPQAIYSTGKPGKAIGFPKVQCHRDWITQTGLDWWMGFFASSEDLYTDVMATVYDPLESEWVTIHAYMWRPTYSIDSAKNYLFRDFTVQLTGIELSYYSVATEFSVTLTNANTEYSYTIPSGTRQVRFRCRNADADIRYAWETGKVATGVEPYQVLSAGSEFVLSVWFTSDATLYFASSIAGVVVEGEAWT